MAGHAACGFAPHGEELSEGDDVRAWSRVPGKVTVAAADAPALAVDRITGVPLDALVDHPAAGR